MEWIGDNVFSLLIVVLPLVIGWLVGRKKGRADTKVVEGNALGGMQGGYTQFVTDMKEKYEEQQKELDELRQELVVMRGNMDLLRAENTRLKQA